MKSPRGVVHSGLHTGLRGPLQGTREGKALPWNDWYGVAQNTVPLVTSRSLTGHITYCTGYGVRTTGQVLDPKGLYKHRYGQARTPKL
jgi:hypothetical protein